MKVTKKPTPNPSLHLSLAVLSKKLGELALPKDDGTVGLIMARTAEKMRVEYTSIRFEVGVPVGGDRWKVHDHGLEDQIAVMCHPVALEIANGQAITMFGDNLSLNLDLGEDNLPIGSVVQIGEAHFEVTPTPHNGCLLYMDRFGKDALRYISAPDQAARRLRGVYFQVMKAGRVSLGDAVTVLSRGPS